MSRASAFASIAGHRQGLAWAGSLEPDVIDETLNEARDNAGFGEPDEWYGLASPADVNGSVVPALDLWRDELVSVPTEEKVRIALDLERATKAADPRIRNVESASYGDALAEAALANSLGVEARSSPDDVFGVGRRARRRRLGDAVGLRVRRRAARCPTSISTRSRATRRPARAGCSAPSRFPAGAFPVILDPLVTRSVLGVLSSAFNGESMLKGRSLFANRVGEKIGAPFVSLIDDPTDARALGASQFDGDGDPDPPQRVDRRRRDAGLLAQRLHGPPFRRGHDRERDARSPVDARSRRAGAAARAGPAVARGDHAGLPATRSTCSR